MPMRAVARRPERRRGGGGAHDGREAGGSRAHRHCKSEKHVMVVAGRSMITRKAFSGHETLGV
jgi:hypothetical protein